MAWDEPFTARDLLTGESYAWTRAQLRELHLGHQPGHVLAIERDGSAAGDGAGAHDAGPVEQPAQVLAPVTAGSASSRWYQDAAIYELHVRAYQDSNADGVGDLAGLIRRLDHIRDLGATAIWLLLLPVAAPRRRLRHRRVQSDPFRGTMRDFRTFLREAHRRDLRAITEVVMNHTSDEHPWFQRARREARLLAAQLLRLGGHAGGYPDARVIFGDFESSNWAWTRSPVSTTGTASTPPAGPELRRAARAGGDVRRRGLLARGLGVDGLRLDAIPYLFEREGTNCENLPRRWSCSRSSGGTSTPRSRTGCCWPRRTSGRRTRSRTSRGRLVSHGVPLPADAADVHGQPDGGSVPADRHPEPDAADPRWIAVGHVPAQSRRADARDGTDEERDYMYRVYARTRRRA